MKVNFKKQKNVVFSSIFAFVLSVIFAWIFKWEVADIVWSFWLSSLFIGFTTIVVNIFSLKIIAISEIIKDKEERTWLQKHVSKPTKLVQIFLWGGTSIFILCFMSFHFCGFHAGHAVFLSHFFPLENLSESKGFDLFGDAFMNPIMLFKVTIKHVLPVYGWFLIPAFINQWDMIFEIIKKKSKSKRKLTKEGLGENSGQFIMLPYLNVIKIHLFIILFAFLFITKQNNFYIYTIVYFFFFFPFNIINFKKESDLISTKNSRKWSKENDFIERSEKLLKNRKSIIKK